MIIAQCHASSLSLPHSIHIQRQSREVVDNESLNGTMIGRVDSVASKVRLSTVSLIVNGLINCQLPTLLRKKEEEEGLNLFVATGVQLTEYWQCICYIAPKRRSIGQQAMLYFVLIAKPRSSTMLPRIHPSPLP